MKKISRRNFIHGSSVLGASLFLFKDVKAGRIFLSARGFDVIIKSGHVIDGTGKKEFIANGRKFNYDCSVLYAVLFPDLQHFNDNRILQTAIRSRLRHFKHSLWVFR